MSKTIFKISGTIFAALTLITLFFPWINAYCEGELASGSVTTTGLGLTEFSVWGTIIIIFPVITSGVAFSNLNKKVKTIFLLVLFLLGSISFYYATSMGIKGLEAYSAVYVQPKYLSLLYPVFMSLSLLSFYLSCNIKNCSLLSLIGIEA